MNERTVYRHFANERALRDAVMARLEHEAGIDLDGLRARRHRRRSPRGSSSTCRRSHSSPRPPLDPTLVAANQRQHDALSPRSRRDDRRLADARPRHRGRDARRVVERRVVRTARRRLGARPRRRHPRRHLGHRSRRGRRQEWSPPGLLTPAGTGALRLVRRELDVERVEAAQHPRRLVVEPARAGAGRGAPPTAGCRACGRGCARC